MRSELKRRIAAWLLLSVLVPMMALTVLHRHQAVADDGVECVQCEHHLPHGGHLTAQTASLDDCVLCQFCGLPFLLPVAILLVAFISIGRADNGLESEFCLMGVVGSKLSRAPPYSF